MAAWSAIASSSPPSASVQASSCLLKTDRAPIGPLSLVSGAAITERTPDEVMYSSAPEPCGNRVSLM